MASNIYPTKDEVVYRKGVGLKYFSYFDNMFYIKQVREGVEILGIKGRFFDFLLPFLALKNAVGSSLPPCRLLLSCSTEELRGWVEWGCVWVRGKN